MKRTFLVLLSVPVLALALGVPAQARDWRGDHRGSSERHAHDGHGDGQRDGRRYEGFGYDGHRSDRGYYRAPPPPPRTVYRAPRRDYYAPPRPSYYRSSRPQWVVGRPYYTYYNGPTYQVDDYYRYPVRRPPPGYHWVRSNTGDLLLVAITTGIIADILMNH